MPKKAKSKSVSSATRDLTKVPAAALQIELARRQRRVGTLVRRHDRLMQKVSALRAEIEALGGITGAMQLRGVEPRPRNKTNLIDALASALAGKTLSVDEAMQAVLEAGYRSTSSSFRKIVNITLARSSRFKRVERGRYAVK